MPNHYFNLKTYRQADTFIASHFTRFKQALVLLGARQVGKTTLIKRVFPKAKYLLVDEGSVKNTLESYDSNLYKLRILGKSQKFVDAAVSNKSQINRRSPRAKGPVQPIQIIIDEAHLLSNPGRCVKLIYDVFPNVQLIVTGSSSFHIKNKLAESMAGRAIYYNLYPLTIKEFLVQTELIDTPSEFTSPYEFIKELMPQRLIFRDPGALEGLEFINYANFSVKQILEYWLLFGFYPEVTNLSVVQSKIEYLKYLADSAIFKDIIELDLIENRVKAKELLALLAYQIGNVINYAELSRSLGISIPTVQRYIDIFEKSFIVFRLRPFIGTRRNELIKSPKIYFWDIGLRNALIKDFNPLSMRNDVGALFENMIIADILKDIAYNRDLTLQTFYWRTKNKSEVDLVLQRQNDLLGIEIKFKKGTFSRAFKNRYPNAKTLVFSPKHLFANWEG